MRTIATLLDVNVWIARAFPLHQFHSKAVDWFDSQSKPDSALFCRATQNSFLRLLTTQTIMAAYASNPYTNPKAWGFYESILSDSLVGFAEEPPRVEETWKSLTLQATPSPKLWMDAYLAAFAVSGDHALLTTDGGFRQFKGLNLILIS